MGQSLSIVIPAYNEQEAIEAILKACLAAREPIRRETGLSSVEVVLVDDGSRDRTAELAGAFKEVRLVRHPVNRGYGAALTTGFAAAKGDYLGFLDADGTCDPLAFIKLFQALKSAQADLAMGNRLHQDSRMPLVREIGNRFFAAVLSWLSGVKVEDTASGMRLFSRSLLPRLSPLPTGLHFTPAMTARAACMGAKIVETPIPYAEREGRSKLNVLADGFRFLRVILGTIFAYYPLRIFGPMGLLFGALALGYGFGPVAYYVKHRHLEEDMIYRLLSILTFAVCAQVCVTFGLLAQKVSDVATGRPPSWLDSPKFKAAAIVKGLVLGLGGILLNSRTILEYVSSGRITIHWVYVLTGGLAVISGTVLVAFGITLDLVAHLPRNKEGS